MLRSGATYGKGDGDDDDVDNCMATGGYAVVIGTSGTLFSSS